MPNQRFINESLWLTHDMVSAAIADGHSPDVLRAYANECDSVKAFAVAKDLRNIATRRATGEGATPADIDYEALRLAQLRLKAAERNIVAASQILDLVKPLRERWNPATNRIERY